MEHSLLHAEQFKCFQPFRGFLHYDTFLTLVRTHPSPSVKLPCSLLSKNASRIFSACGAKVFCRFREYQRAHPRTPFACYSELGKQCLLERQFVSLEENREWINATASKYFMLFINSPFKLAHADSQNVTASFLRKNHVLSTQK